MGLHLATVGLKGETRGNASGRSIRLGSIGVKNEKNAGMAEHGTQSGVGREGAHEELSSQKYTRQCGTLRRAFATHTKDGSQENGQRPQP